MSLSERAKRGYLVPGARTIADEARSPKGFCPRSQELGRVCLAVVHGDAEDRVRERSQGRHGRRKMPAGDGASCPYHERHQEPWTIVDDFAKIERRQPPTGRFGDETLSDAR